MLYTKLNNGVQMPLLGFGCYRLTDPQESSRAIEAALATGYRLFDTAEFYKNEEIVGKTLRASGIAREDLFLTTKVWFRNFEAGECRQSVLNSLAKLRVDYLDLVLLHWPFGNTYAAWRDLEALYEEGLIRAIGISNFSPAQFVDLLTFNKIKPQVNQLETHIFCQQKEAQAWHKKYDIVHQAYTPLARGRVADFEACPAITKAMEKYQKTSVQIILRFLMQSGISIIPKSSHPERIKENFDLFDFSLTEAEMEALRQLDRDEKVVGLVEDPDRLEQLLKL